MPLMCVPPHPNLLLACPSPSAVPTPSGRGRQVIRNNKDFFDQSLGEIKLLRYLNALDPHDSEHILRMRDFFYFRCRGRACVTG